MKYEPNEKFSEIRLTHLKRIKAFFQSLRESEAAMRISILLLSFLITLIIISSCDNNPTGPEEPPPGRRDYIVKVDTVEPSSIYFYDIWGLQSSNIWAVASGNLLGNQKVWHYDRENWQLEEDTPWISAYSIFGFSESDIWIAGNEGRILHYDGTQWKLISKEDDPEWKLNNFGDVWGISSDDLYAVGHTISNNDSYGLIVHYNGSEWENVEIPTIRTQFWKIRRGRKDNSKYYLIGNNVDLTYPDSSRIFELDGENLKEIYYGQPFTESQPSIEEIDGHTYFAFDRKIHTYRNSKFIVKEDIYHPNVVNAFHGRTLHDLILPTNDGVAHYNGQDVQYLYQNLNFVGLSFLVLEDSFFATGYDFNNNINLFVRGILKDK